MTHSYKTFVNPALAVSFAGVGAYAFIVSPAKAPWVDELYTWYGIRHETFGQFAESMASGVNFSPPLYFFLNWLGQLAVPLSLDALRMESLLWILGGAFLANLAVRPAAGELASAAGAAVVLLQSVLLREQAQEARQYGMLFFCGAAVAFSSSRLLKSPSCKKSQALHFLAHLALCLTHYLGIVFSVAATLAQMIARNRKDGKFGPPRIEMLAWAPAITLYLWLLSHQSSHLGNWPRPNAIADLASLYLGSFLPMTLAIPFLALLLTKEIKSPNPKALCTETQVARFHLLLFSLFWLTIPAGVWLLSHLSEFNLFKARYFIPKEVGCMLLLSILLSKLPAPSTPCLKNHLPHLTIITFSLAFLALATQRFLFSLDPAHNYHHRLIVDASILNSSPPKIYAGDHLYFPNKYASPAKTVSFLLLPSSQKDTYRRFSKHVKTLTPEEAKLLPQYLLVTDKERPNESALPSRPNALSQAYHLRGRAPGH